MFSALGRFSSNITFNRRNKLRTLSTPERSTPGSVPNALSSAAILPMKHGRLLLSALILCVTPLSTNTFAEPPNRIETTIQTTAESTSATTSESTTESTAVPIYGIEALETPQAARPPLPEGPWFQVEVYIFRQTSGNTSEVWPAKDPINFATSTSLMTVDLTPTNASDIAFQQLSTEQVQSYDVGQRLAGSRNYKMLYKAAWRQPFVSRQEAPTVFISAGNQETSNRRELEGTLRLHKGRYLHVDAHLVLGKYEEHFQEIGATPAPTTLGTSSNANTPLPSQANAFDDTEPLVASPEVMALEIFELKESRRMRSGELHYLDHPKFGMLIQINRIKENQG